jgi:ribosomal protein S27AE
MEGAEVMDSEESRNNVAAVAVRRAVESGTRADEKSRWKCGACGAAHTSYNSHVEHGLCEACREDAFTVMRQTLQCCRCGDPVQTLKPSSAAGRSAPRFLACFRCALIVARDPADRVNGTSVEYKPK